MWPAAGRWGRTLRPRTAHSPARVGSAGTPRNISEVFLHSFAYFSLIKSVLQILPWELSFFAGHFPAGLVGSRRLSRPHPCTEGAPGAQRRKHQTPGQES